MSISIDEAEKIATEFIKKKRGDMKITINEVTRINPARTKVTGTYLDPAEATLGSFNWEVVIRGDKQVSDYKIP